MSVRRAGHASAAVGIALLWVTAFHAASAATQQPGAESTSAPATRGAPGVEAAPTLTGAAAKPLASDEGFRKLGEEFDLDAYIASLTPDADEALRSLPPAPPLEELLAALQQPRRGDRAPVDAKRADELDKTIRALRRAGDYAAALLKVEKVVALYEVSVDAAWQLDDARRLVDTCRRLAAMAPAEQAAAAYADRADEEIEKSYAEGQYAQATALSRAQLAIRVRVLGRCHVDTVMSLHNLGAVALAAGDYDRSVAAYRAALVCCRSATGTQNPLFAATLASLAGPLTRQGHLADVAGMYTAALDVLSRTLEREHPYVRSALNNLAVAYSEMGDLARAEALARAVVVLDDATLAEDAPERISSLNTLGGALWKLGQFSAAEAEYRKALTICERQPTPEHPAWATTLRNLGNTLQDQGRYVEAETCHRAALTMRRAYFPEGHDDVAISMTNVATLCALKGDRVSAIALEQEALAMRRRVLGTPSAGEAVNLNNLGLLYQRQGDVGAAGAVFEEALRVQRAVFGERSADAARTLLNLAMLRRAQGELTNAGALAREALAILRETLGPEHADTAAAVNSCAVLLEQQGDAAAAEPLYREALEFQRRALGDWHPAVAGTLCNLAGLLQARGGDGQSVKLLREAVDILERQRTQIIGVELDRARFSGSLGLPAAAARLASVLLRLDEPREALEALERGRSRALLDLLEGSKRVGDATERSAGTASTTSSPALALERDEQARGACAAAEAAVAAVRGRADLPVETREKLLDEKLAKLREARAAAAGAAQDRLAAMRVYLPDGRPANSGEILAALGDGDALLEYCAQDHRFLLIVAWSEKRRPHATVIETADESTEDTGQVRGFQLAEGQAETMRLRQLADAVRCELSHRPAGPRAQPSSARSELARRVLPEEVRRLLDDSHRVIIVSDGTLGGIPFEALWDSGLANARPTHEGGLPPIVYAPSATVYLDRKGARNGEQGTDRTAGAVAVVLGAPLFDRQHKEPEYPQQGVLIADAVEGGNAAKAGLQRGDVLLRYGDQILDEQTPLQKAMGAVGESIQNGERSAEAPVKVAYWRAGREAEVELPPGKLGVQVQAGRPDDGLRSMALIEQVTRAGGEFSAGCSATEQVRLYGGVLPPLPGTQREVQSIAGLFAAAGRSATVLTGEEATVPKLRAAIAAASPRYLHLATHGLMGSPDRPYDASLALTQPEKPTPEDIGFLRLEDLMSTWGGRLKGCELVVLSACDTQLGQQQGDTLMSLPLGFFFAGTPTVIASLWKVDDTATTLLMTRFYENLLGRFDAPRAVDGCSYAAGRALPKLAALREAQVWLRGLTGPAVRRILNIESDEGWASALRALRGIEAGETVTATAPATAADTRLFEHPYYWAAFVLIGDPD